MKKGTPLTERVKDLLRQNEIHYLDFPLPYETSSSVPYTFSEETELAFFRLAQKTYRAFQADSLDNPLDIRKEAYDIITGAFQEFQQIARTENPSDGRSARRSLRSILHLRTIGALDDYLFEHAKNVSLYCLTLGYDYFRESRRQLADIHKVAVAGLFADIGMMKIPASIRQKKEKLTERELEVIRKHPIISGQFTESLFRQKNFVTPRIVRQHHERCDGSGYPKKLRGDELEPYSFIVSVADSYASMISKRNFRPPMNPIEAIWELNDQAGRSYDEKTVRCLNFRAAPYAVGSVARFAGSRLVQVVDLDNIPLHLEDVRIVKKKGKENPYNSPKSIRVFAVDKLIHRLKVVSIRGHLDKMGSLLDQYDLLVLYDYATKEMLGNKKLD